LLKAAEVENHIMENNIEKFQKDFYSLSNLFPDLRRKPSPRNVFQIEGSLPVYDSNGFLIDIFATKIIYSSSYPKGFAKLYEIGGDIERSDDWHKYSDDQCCVCSLPEELILQQKSNNAIFFIREYAIPFLANFLHKKKYGKYPNGEYPHGNDGTIQWYKDQFPDESTRIHPILERILIGKNIPKHYEQCLCGSKTKFKKCHQRFYNEILLIPRKELIKHFSILKQNSI